MSSKQPLFIDFFGDVSLNGLYCDPLHLSDLRSDLIALKNEIDSPALKVINWESPISTKLDFNKSKGTLLATTIEAAEVFSEFAPDVAILGNNHIADCRNDGFHETISFLKRKKIEYVGARKKDTKVNHDVNSLILKKNNIKIGFLSYVGCETNPRIEKDVDIEVSFIDKDVIVQEISLLRKNVDLLIVSLHWGAEFILYPSIEQKKLARTLIDRGADIIYGHHSHSLQGMEVWNKGVIFYSLGNFIFSGLKGKESYGWPSVSDRSGFYRICYKKEEPLNVEFHPLLTSNRIRLTMDDKYIKQQKDINKTLCNDGWSYKIRRELGIAYVWGWVLPLFFIKTRGGLIKALKDIKTIHLKLFLNNILMKK